MGRGGQGDRKQDRKGDQECQDPFHIQFSFGYVAEDDGNYFFRQEQTNALLEDIASPDAPGVQREFYDNNKGNFDFYTQTQTVQDGKAAFSGLTTGLYLIVQNKAADGFSKMDAFLVSVPCLEDGEYQYHVTASIKSELERDIPSLLRQPLAD